MNDFFPPKNIVDITRAKVVFLGGCCVLFGWSEIQYLIAKLKNQRRY